MIFITSSRGLALIKEFEGLRLDAYRDPVGIWTIGYGTTRLPDGSPVREGMLITKERAEKLLRHDLLEFERQVHRLVEVELNQNQFDALVCFAYNVGARALETSTLRKKLNAGDYAGAANEFLRWNKAGGRVLNGLVRRRAAERELFLSKP